MLSQQPLYVKAQTSKNPTDLLCPSLNPNLSSHTRLAQLTLPICPLLLCSTMATGYDYDDATAVNYDDQGGPQRQDLGYDPNFVPDSVKSFVVHLYRHIREKNVYEIHQMYETSFQTLSERLFKETPWPSVDAVAHYVDNDHVFCLLYREMWFRHLYARLSPTLKQRIDSWDNYCSLFQVLSLLFFFYLFVCFPCVSLSYE